ncbi:MAG: hypothetical protein WBN65_13495 [Gammaproteobacteria bacterium]
MSDSFPALADTGVEGSRDSTPQRPVPPLPWLRITSLALLVLLLSVSAWEWQTRRLGLLPGDLGDGSAFWAAERRKVDHAGPGAAVIVGSSRILFDTDLALLEDITGRQVIQLALPGTGPRAFIEDLADNTDFRGLLIVGVTPTAFFRKGPGLMGGAIEYAQTETPAQRFGHRLFLLLARTFGFLDADYTLIKLLRNHRYIEREGVAGPYADVWKISIHGPARQTWLWSRIETDDYLRQHARLAWGDFSGAPIADGDIRSIIETTRHDVERIRSRGGEVVFVRPPSTGPLRENEARRIPRAWGWDRLLRATGALGIHFEDYPEMLGLDLPEWSHLSRESARRFTQAYATVLTQEIDADPGLQ